ncbi:MAG: hypothetical protein M3R47_05900, partial [Chloroflexota bacterium]|nr:hypothetical protein [Chloroflexota bacterium]
MPSQTGTPTPVTTVIATEPAVTTPLLSLVADPGFITADSKLMLDWVIEGVIIEEHKSLLLQITLPDELSLQEGYEGTYDETSRTLTITVTALSGQVTLLTGSSVSDTKLQAILMDETNFLAENTLFLPVHEEFLVDERGGVVTA